MNVKPIIVIFLYSLLLLFYPGDNPLAVNLSQVLDKVQNKNVKGEKVSKFKLLFLKNKNLPEVSAKSVFIVEQKNFLPLYKKNENKRLYPASTTKIITALVALDVYKPSDIIEVKREITEGRVMGLIKGERITVENLLYGLLIHSANDSAFALADYYGYEKFIELMNKKAKELGMKNTNFTNPAGFEDPRHYSTAFDLAVAGRALLQNNFLRKMVGIKEITVADVDYKIFHKLMNVNKLLGEIPGVAGIKTGYTPQAGENLISLYKMGGNEIIVVILGSEDRFEDTAKIIYWLQSSLGSKNL